jgi:hypothetical protein
VLPLNSNLGASAGLSLSTAAVAGTWMSAWASRLRSASMALGRRPSSDAGTGPFRGRGQWLDADVRDLEVLARLGFVTLKAGGAGSGSAVHLGAQLTAILDRDPSHAGGERFDIGRLLTDGPSALHLGFTGDAFARLRDLRVLAGGAGMNVGAGLELGLYVQDLTNWSSFKLVTSPNFNIQDAGQRKALGLTDKDVVGGAAGPGLSPRSQPPEHGRHHRWTAGWWST